MIIEIPASRTRTSVATEDSEEEPLLEPNAAASDEPRTSIKKEIHSPRFELGVARLSLAFDAAAYALMVVYPSRKIFVIFGLFGAMGIGFSPAMQTLAMAMYSRRGGTETGRLFGALSVVQALACVFLSVTRITLTICRSFQWTNLGASGLWICLHQDGCRLPKGHLPRGFTVHHRIVHPDELCSIAKR